MRFSELKKHFYLTPAFLRYYREVLLDRIKPDICVIDSLPLSEILPTNNKRGIETIYAAHNIESLLDLCRGGYGRRVLDTAPRFFHEELRRIANFKTTVCISSVEKYLLQGAGFHAELFPYHPVGMVRDFFSAVRKERNKSTSPKAIYLLVGNAHHAPTHRSILEFAQRVSRSKLKPSKKIVVIGHDTDCLELKALEHPWLNFRGHVSFSEFRELLVNSAMGIVPQTMGFGALTRIPELSCAGLPLITTEHSVIGVSPPPGIVVAPQERWELDISQFEFQIKPNSSQEFNDWANAQPNPWTKLLGITGREKTSLRRVK